MESGRSSLGVWMRAGADQTPPSPDVLLPLIYDELRAVAHREMANQRQAHTLQTTALVHEAYLRLGADPAASWDNKRHYFHAAAIAMRHILVDHARARVTHKRGGGRARTPLEDIEFVSPTLDLDWLGLDAALTKLEAFDPDLAQMVSLRYFAGLSVEQVASARGVSPSTVAREWRVARAFLEEALRERKEPGG